MFVLKKKKKDIVNNIPNTCIIHVTGDYKIYRAA